MKASMANNDKEAMSKVGGEKDKKCWGGTRNKPNKITFRTNLENFEN